MFSRVCIANRGEIAVRIARTCRRLGIETHAVHSDADARAMHVRIADGASLIGPGPVAESYLNIAAVIEAATRAGCDAVHPGYGLLSENPDFARACAQHDLAFIGPSADHIDLMGHKNRARDAMQQFAMPVIPGTAGDLADDDLHASADAVGYPLIVKASRGGGGIGMAVVEEPARLDRAVQRARSTATRAFGSSELYLERQIVGAHHVEVQIFGDTVGQVVHLGERECSVQRRHQKVVEETPSPSVDARLRDTLTLHATTAMARLGYRNAGTVECLVAPDGEFFFLEMNTRLQVEHAVTEMVTGLDLVEWQLRIAAGDSLEMMPLAPPRGHAIEARIYAEDPETFLPAPGQVRDVHFPAGDGIRVDAAIEPGDEVSQFYDPLIAKLVVWAPDRPRAVAKLGEALRHTRIDGIKHNVPFLQRVVASTPFVEGDYDIRIVAQLSE